jgi:hypothetical protein
VIYDCSVSNSGSLFAHTNFYDEEIAQSVGLCREDEMKLRATLVKMENLSTIDANEIFG